MQNSKTIHIRAGAFEGFRDLLGEHGIDPRLIFSEIDLDEASLNFPDFWTRKITCCTSPLVLMWRRFACSS